MKDYFDAIIDGETVTAAKPDPEVFIKGASELGLNNEECIVFEDSASGIEAAHNANMLSYNKKRIPGRLFMGRSNGCQPN